jgi:hypothetical protein
LDEDEQWPHLSILGKVRQLFSAIADDPRRNLFQQIKMRYCLSGPYDFKQCCGTGTGTGTVGTVTF